MVSPWHERVVYAAQYYGRRAMVPAIAIYLPFNSKGEVQVVGRPTFLPSDEELVLVNWAIRRAIICCPVTRKELVDCVQNVYCEINANTSFKDNRPSMGWVNKLKARHKLSFRRSEDLDGGRTRVIMFLRIPIYF